MTYLVALKHNGSLASLADEFRKRNKTDIAKYPRIPTHCTIAYAALDGMKEEELISGLESIASKQSSIQMKCGHIALFDQDSIVTLVENNRPLLDLHKNVIKLFSKHLDHKEINIEYYEEYPEREAVIEKYGSPYVAGWYQPHITLGRAKPDAKIQDFEETELTGFQWVANKFILWSYDGKNWEIEKEFELKK